MMQDDDDTMGRQQGTMREMVMTFLGLEYVLYFIVSFFYLLFFIATYSNYYGNMPHAMTP